MRQRVFNSEQFPVGVHLHSELGLGLTIHVSFGQVFVSSVHEAGAVAE